MDDNKPVKLTTAQRIAERERKKKEKIDAEKAQLAKLKGLRHKAEKNEKKATEARQKADNEQRWIEIGKAMESYALQTPEFDKWLKNFMTVWAERKK